MDREIAQQIADDLNTMHRSPWAGQVVIYDAATGEGLGDLGRPKDRPAPTPVRGRLTVRAGWLGWTADSVMERYDAQMRQMDEQREWIERLRAELAGLDPESGRARDLRDMLRGKMASGEWPTDMPYEEATR